MDSKGTEVSGAITSDTFHVLVFEVHAENEEQQLGTGRISKLWLRCQADRLMCRKRLLRLLLSWQPVVMLNSVARPRLRQR